MIHSLYYKYYIKIFPNYRKELKKAVGVVESLLDVGCGCDSPIESFSQNLYCVGVDTFLPSIVKSKKRHIHDKYYQMDVLGISSQFKPNSFDVVLASDVIEHLEKEDGNKLISKMEKIAKKKVIIFTPNGFLKQGEFDNNPWQVHKSGWNIAEMESKGYKVIGINGWKPLRGEYGYPTLKPKFIGAFISDISQVFVRNRPEKAFAILCIKTKG